MDASEKSTCMKLVHYLTDHEVKQLYCFVWIWAEDNSIMRRWKGWFTNREVCKQDSKRNGPSYTTFDGPGSPTALLCLEAVCPCFVHQIDKIEDLIVQPCLCFTPTIPETFKDLCELHIDGLTVIKVPVVHFTSCSKYEYIIKETGVVFTSHEKHIYLAYLERKLRRIVSSFIFL